MGKHGKAGFGMEDSRLVLPALCIREQLRPFLSMGLRYVFTDTDHGFIKSLPYTELSDTKNRVFSKNGTDTNAYIPEKKMQTQTPSVKTVFAKSPYSAPKSGHDTLKSQEKKTAVPTEFHGEKKTVPSQTQSHSSPLKDSNARSPRSNNILQSIDTISKNWPEPWRTYWQSIGQCRPVVWTYWELGLDISGRADAQRGALLRKFNTELELPSGTNAYWPIAAPDQTDKLFANKDIFLAGLERIAPRFTLVCGKRALAALAPDNAIEAFSTQFLYNCLVLALPEIMDILENSEIQNKTLVFLRRYLSSLKA